MKINSKIGIVGTIPPPFGGVSIFLKRLLDSYKQNNISFELISFHQKTKIEKLQGIIKILFNQSYSTIIINSSNINVLGLFVLRISKSKIIYYDHNFRFIEHLNRLQLLIFRLFLAKIDELWGVESKVIDYYNSFNLKLPTIVTIKNAYLPPVDTAFIDLFFLNHRFLDSFIAMHYPIIVSNASSIMFYKNIDLYGLDIQINLISKLRENYPEIGLIIALAEINDKEYFKHLLDEIIANNVQDNILILTSKDEIWPLFTKAQLMIRPTLSDGDSISIREALHFNVPVVASDCTLRPRNTVIFKNRDVTDLLLKCNKIFNSEN